MIVSAMVHVDEIEAGHRIVNRCGDVLEVIDAGAVVAQTRYSTVSVRRLTVRLPKSLGDLEHGRVTELIIDDREPIEILRPAEVWDGEPGAGEWFAP